MAKKKQGVSKSQAVRDYLTENPDATASVVVPELAKRGIKVSPALVSQVKQRMKQAGDLDGQKTTAKKRPGRRSSTRKPTTVSTSKALTANDLVEAKKRVDDLGGIDQARKALKYLEELG